MSNALVSAIYTRSQVASNYKTSIGGRQYFIKASKDENGNLTYPFVIFFILADKNDDYFNVASDSTQSLESVRCQFNIHSNTSSSANEVTTIAEYLKTHYDYCSLSVTGNNSMVMRRTNIYGPFWMNDTEEWIYSIEYSVELQKTS